MNNQMQSHSPLSCTKKEEDALERNHTFSKPHFRVHRTTLFWFTCFLIALGVTLGALQAYKYRLAMNPDGICYLDMGDALVSGHWSTAINAYWSPLYAVFVGLALRVGHVSPGQEFAAVHVVNFGVYLLTLLSFVFLWKRIGELRTSVADSPETCSTADDLTWVTFGGALFLWSTLDLISLELVTPDLCIAALVFLIVGLLISVYLRPRSGTFVLLGVAMSIGYYAKAIIFPLALIVLASILIFSVKNGVVIRRVMLAAIAFGVIASPWVTAISLQKGRWTFGDSGKLNYEWQLNRTRPWLIAQLPTGKPYFHPVRKITSDPQAYEYATPIRGVMYPFWYDPSYWFDGLRMNVSLSKQFGVLKQNAYELLFKLGRAQEVLIISALLLIPLLDFRRAPSAIFRSWSAWIVSIAGIAMYLLVAVEDRYLGAFLPAFWASVFLVIWHMRRPRNRKAVTMITAAAALIIIAIVLRNCLSRFYPSTAHALIVAEALRQSGLRPGDSVAIIGDPYRAYWARLDRLTIVAEVPHRVSNRFWQADNGKRHYIFQGFRLAGAKVVLANQAPDDPGPDWQRIESTEWYVHSLGGVLSVDAGRVR